MKLEININLKIDSAIITLIEEILLGVVTNGEDENSRAEKLGKIIRNIGLDIYGDDKWDFYPEEYLNINKKEEPADKLKN